MLLGKVAEMEKVDVTGEDVDAEIQKMAEYYQATPEQLRESLERQGGGLDDIRGNLKTRKAIESVISKIRVTEGEWVDENAPEVVSEEEKPKKKPAKKPSAKKAAKSE
jgi:trigger factor